MILCCSSATSLLFSSCGSQFVKHCLQNMGTHIQTHTYRVTRSSLRKCISVFGMYSQEGRIRRVFLELDRKGCTYNHACGRWCRNTYHEIQSSGKEDSTKFSLVSSPVPWTTYTPTHILPGYSHPDIPVVLLVPLVQFCYSSFPLTPTHEYGSTNQIQSEIYRRTMHSFIIPHPHQFPFF